MRENKKLLELSGLSISFKYNASRLNIVRNINLSIEKRETIALIGESGSGKSMVGMAILRLLPTIAQTSGKILFEGKDLSELSEEEMEEIRGKEISWIPQNPGNALNPIMKVGNQILEAIEKHLGIGERKAMEIAKDLFQELDLLPPEKRLKEYPFQYSGGMKQRALIALGLALKPKLVIADEPTKGIDRIKLCYLGNLFGKIKKECAMLVITHDLSFAEKIADKVAVMYFGEIVEKSDVTSFFNLQLHPYSKGLMESLPSHGLKPIRGVTPSYMFPPKGCKFHPRCDYRLEVCDKLEPPVISVDEYREVKCWLYARDS
ncbi:MAG: ABC transporter ATP-binding protein [Synergistetes bacterium]|nr:ABC transporter ATP-binding protein [Synergistota bacterium]MDK2870655.1 peptide/nickel transport system ATP-binding protein [bacterium]